MEYAGKFLIEYPSRSDRIRLWALADFHFWNRNCAVAKLKADLATIAADNHSFATGIGDYGDFITWSDKRFDAEAIADDVTVKDLSQMGHALSEQLQKLLSPIKGRLIGLGKGNHEKKYEVLREHSEMHSSLCYQLGVPNFGYSAFYDIVFARTSALKAPRLTRQTHSVSGMSDVWSVRVFQHHGAGAAQTHGGKMNRLTRFMQQHEADLYLVAHLHDETMKKLIRIGANRACTEPVQKVTLGTITGTYLRTYEKAVTGYGEQRGYDPTPLGAVVVEFEPDKRKMRLMLEAEL